MTYNAKLSPVETEPTTITLGSNNIVVSVRVDNTGDVPLPFTLKTYFMGDLQLTQSHAPIPINDGIVIRRSFIYNLNVAKDVKIEVKLYVTPTNQFLKSSTAWLTYKPPDPSTIKGKIKDFEVDKQTITLGEKIKLKMWIENIDDKTNNYHIKLFEGNNTIRTDNILSVDPIPAPVREYSYTHQPLQVGAFVYRAELHTP